MAKSVTGRNSSYGQNDEAFELTNKQLLYLITSKLYTRSGTCKKLYFLMYWSPCRTFKAHRGGTLWKSLRERINLKYSPLILQYLEFDYSIFKLSSGQPVNLTSTATALTTEPPCCLFDFRIFTFIMTITYLASQHTYCGKELFKPVIKSSKLFFNRADTGAKRRGSSSCWELESTDEEESSWCRAASTTSEETGRVQFY